MRDERDAKGEISAARNDAVRTVAYVDTEQFRRGERQYGDSENDNSSGPRTVWNCGIRGSQ